MRKRRSAHNRTPTPRPRARASSPESEQNSRRRGKLAGLVPRGTHVWQLLVLLLLTAGIYLILTAGRPPLGVELGKPAPRDFLARIDFQCVDIESSWAAKERARRQSPLVFNAAEENLQRSADALLAIIREGEQSPDWEAMALETQEALRPLLPLLGRQAEPIKEALDHLAELVVANPSEMPKESGDQATKIVILGTREVPEREVPREEVVLLGADSSAFGQVFTEPLKQIPADKRAAVLVAFAELLHPTVVLDKGQTHLRAEAAAGMQPPVMQRIPRGAPMLEEGAKVREQDIAMLEAERGRYWESRGGRWVRYQHLAGLAVVVLSVVLLGSAYSAKYRPELVHNRVQSISFVLLTLSLVGLASGFVVLGIPLLAVPVPLATMVLCLVFDQRFGFETAALYGLVVAMAQGTPGQAFAVLTLGAMMAALLTGKVRARSTLIKAGLLVGCVQWLAAWGLGLLVDGSGSGGPHRFWESMFSAGSLCALGNGIMSGFLVSGLLPAIERLFRVTTDIRLLEWSDPNQPLLQRLLLEAPGTYHHSMIVGSLAAEAAEAVGANPLLARVSAYFHDIGKLKKPEYFAENIPENGKNPHEDLSPTMSSLIITVHPRDGAEMAERHGLPREVRDIILQSHGSTVMKYFWSRAKQRGPQSSDLQESTFRYRAPKPASKEAACVMLCDAVESAARALKSPSGARIEGLVREILMDRLHDGQLAESGLTVTDLDRIEKSLVRGLHAVFHNRVRYPGQEEEPAQESHEEASDRGDQPAA